MHLPLKACIPQGPCSPSAPENRAYPPEEWALTLLSPSTLPVWHILCGYAAIVRVAVSTHSGRISPVFDVAECLLLLDTEGDRLVRRREERIAELEPLHRVRRLSELGVEALICGAISGPLEERLAETGIQVISQRCGPIDDVLRAFVSGELREGAFLMPGCCGRRRRLRGRRGHGQQQREGEMDDESGSYVPRRRSGQSG